ncbi:MAG TPA: Asp-tRNA(Asn)/Glu-tRNA(Gln) amidotransferase subunit GatC [Candidatus Limnocylindria bacterium]|nr:Asp-tRNA(Asn)/Glu-tRNA(Gln) amidotransferase subunit GatC [Candidatus Limnocylindria bacterium]
MSTIDRATVEKVAGLARIALTEAEVARFTDQLSVVLDAVDRLRAVDTSDVPPTASILPTFDVMRADEPEPSLPLEDVFRNAPLREGDLFRVQTPLEER